MALEGSLREFSLADILQLLFFQKKTGVLLLQGRLDRVRLLFFEGNIVGAESRKRDVENRLGRVLEKRGIISLEDLQAAVEKQKEEGGKFGSVLVRMGLAGKEQIQDVITFQITETLVQLFSWKEGRYEFTPQSVPLDRETGVVLNTEHFLMEGVRLVDEWAEIKDRIDIYSVFEPAREARAGLTPEEEKVLSFVDGVSDVGAIAVTGGIDSFQVSMALLSLQEKGVVKRRVKEEAHGEERVEAKPVSGLTWVVAALMLFALAYSIAVYMGAESGYTLHKAWKEVDALRFRIEAEKHQKGSYPPAVNKADPWGNPYRYSVTEDGFTLRSPGPDGKFDTPDDVY